MDIAPELLNRIQNSFREGYTHNKKIASIVSKVGAGKGTGADSVAFATEVGNELKKAFSENVQPDILPDEKMYRNIAEKIFPPLLKKNHELINTVSKEVAKTTAQKEGLNLNGIDVPIDKNKIDGIVKHASNAPKYENIKKSTENSLVNYSQAVNDESVKKNAEFVGDSGVKAYIIRTTTGKCCEWCTNIAGKYEYGQEPKDIYRRHANCDCVVEYVTDGKSQNVHTKQWATKEEIEARKNTEPPRPSKEDVEKLKKLAEEQEYKPITRGTVNIKDEKVNVTLNKLENYENIYASNKVELKPKQVHIINKDFNNAISAYEGDKSIIKPTIAIVDNSEIGSFAVAKYDCVKNTIYVTPEVGTPKKLVELQKDLACGSNPSSTMYHEAWHWKQAEEYRRKNGEITSENRADYMIWLNDKCKKRLEKVGVNEYNVSEVSEYAKHKWKDQRYDEVEAEYNTKKTLRG